MREGHDYLDGGARLSGRGTSEYGKKIAPTTPYTSKFGEHTQGHSRIVYYYRYVTL